MFWLESLIFSHFLSGKKYLSNHLNCYLNIGNKAFNSSCFSLTGIWLITYHVIYFPYFTHLCFCTFNLGQQLHFYCLRWSFPATYKYLLRIGHSSLFFTQLIADFRLEANLLRFTFTNLIVMIFIMGKVK